MLQSQRTAGNHAATVAIAGATEADARVSADDAAFDPLVLLFHSSDSQVQYPLPSSVPLVAA